MSLRALVQVFVLYLGREQHVHSSLIFSVNGVIGAAIWQCDNGFSQCGQTTSVLYIFLVLCILYSPGILFLFPRV